MNDALSWFAVRITVGDDELEIATAVLADHGYPSCEIREALGHNRAEVVFYVKANDHAAAVALAAAAISGINSSLGLLVKVEAIADTDWRENWKRFFPPMKVGSRLEIVPPWEKPQSADPTREVVVIDPGMAFGTGHHETTAACLELLDRWVGPNIVVADVGCGSGILAIAAAKLGAPRVVAMDNDPIAVNAARANVVSNRVERRVIVVEGSGPPTAAFGKKEERFDLVVANIYAERLVAMRDVLTSCVKPGGRLVLSGIESLRRPLIEDAFVGTSWTISARIERADWLTVAVRRNT